MSSHFSKKQKSRRRFLTSLFAVARANGLSAAFSVSFLFSLSAQAELIDLSPVPMATIVRSLNLALAGKRWSASRHKAGEDFLGSLSEIESLNEEDNESRLLLFEQGGQPRRDVFYLGTSDASWSQGDRVFVRAGIGRESALHFIILHPIQMAEKTRTKSEIEPWREEAVRKFNETATGPLIHVPLQVTASFPSRAVFKTNLTGAERESEASKQIVWYVTQLSIHGPHKISQRNVEVIVNRIMVARPCAGELAAEDPAKLL